jgi:MoxR-like ATPase
MAGKWRVEDLTVDAVMETTFWLNDRRESGYRFRATHLDGKRAPKVVLSDDRRIRSGIPCQVRIVAIHKPERADHGFVQVEFVALLPLRPEGVYLDPVASKKLQVLLESGLNILLDGPQGCGKTVLARALATALGMEFVFFNCSAVVEASDFSAVLQVRSSPAGHPVTEFIKTELLLALEAATEHPELQYLVFLDEFNRCAEGARNALMPALDATRKVYNPVTGAFLPIPENVQFIAAVNRGSEFSGTFGIDAAQLDRFAPLQMDYLPMDEEVALLLQRHPELGRAMIRRVVEVADRIRRAPEVSTGLSVRATEEACIYLKHPLFAHSAKTMLAEVLKSSFCGRFNGRWDDVTTDAGVVWTVITTTLKGEGTTGSDA